MFEDYRAVSIRHPDGCCRAATVLDGKRFLSTNAPSLPLTNCSMPGLCTCEYRTLADRREDELEEHARRERDIPHLRKAGHGVRVDVLVQLGKHPPPAPHGRRCDGKGELLGDVLVPCSKIRYRIFLRFFSQIIKL